MIRGLRPTDLLAYIVFRKRVGRSNEAILRPDGRTSPLSIRSFIGRSLSLEPGREAWIEIGEGEIRGLAATRARWGAPIWDVDQLLALPSSHTDSTYVNLLQHVCNSAARTSVHKVFLRLDRNSEALAAGRQAGFYHYTTEHVFRLSGVSPDAASAELTLRPRRRADQQALFQLYCSSVPASVRQVEGMTLQEWRSADGWRPQPVGWQGGIHAGRQDLVCANGSAVLAAVRTDRSARVLSILLHPELQSKADALIEATLLAWPAGGELYIAARDYQTGLLSALERCGAHVASHALLARVTTVRVVERTLMPLRA